MKIFVKSQAGATYALALTASVFGIAVFQIISSGPPPNENSPHESARLYLSYAFDSCKAPKEIDRKSPLTTTLTGIAPEKFIAEETPSVSEAQKGLAFRQLQEMVETQELDAPLSNGAIARFRSVGRRDPHWVKGDFTVRTDRYGNIVVPNPANGFEADFTTFSETGAFSVRCFEAVSDLRVRFSSIGHGPKKMRRVGKILGKPTVIGSRVEIPRGEGVTEWYINSESGLEQGWTLQAPLSSQDSRDELRLSIELEATGMLTRFEHGGQLRWNERQEDAIVFMDHKGREALRYGKLLVLDALGNKVQSWIEWNPTEKRDGGSLDIVIADAGVTYPLTIDPLISSRLGNFFADSEGSSPQHLVTVGDTVYFAAQTDYFGTELWKSDGSTEGTVLVKDINPLGASSYPSDFCAVGDTLFFATLDGLWKSDGTPEGTVLVADMFSGSGVPAHLVALDETIFFSATAGFSTGNELWKSDGTSEGTILVADINPGSESSFPFHLVAFGGEVFFRANDGSQGAELWKTDGTSEGTVLVADILPGSGSSFPAYLAAAGGDLFFTASDGLNGRELWKTDGTSVGTVLVEDIASGPVSSAPNNLLNFNGILFFSANDGSSGEELWKSDGTSVGTTLMKDIIPGPVSSSPDFLVAAGQSFFFTAGGNNRELWKSDGTPAGTILVKDINGSTASSSPSHLIANGSTLFFSANDGSNGHELWKSNGTLEGTEIVRDIQPARSSDSEITVLGESLFFSADDGSRGTELWKSDGTKEGTTLVADINPGTESSTPGDLVAVGETLFFRASDGTTGLELWKSDGTSGGTVQVDDILPGAVSSNPTELVAVGDTLFFVALNGTIGSELWKSDGSTEGTAIVEDLYPDSSYHRPSNLIISNNSLFFTASDDTGAAELWRSDGTPAGTFPVKYIAPHIGLYSLDHLAALDDTLYFRAYDETVGSELWKSDGTLEGTALVKDVHPGSSSSSPENITTVGEMVFFTTVFPDDLWKSDGTPEGTVLVKSGSSYNFPSNFLEYDNKLFFNAGGELWVSDGTSDGTNVIAINLVIGSWLPTDIFAASKGLFFAGYDNSRGVELWKTDSTADSTVLVEDINPGPPSSYPHSLTTKDEFLYFFASDAGGGISLHSLPLLPPPDNLDLVDESDTGSSQDDNITKDTTPTITGTAPPGASVTVYSSADLDLDGNFGTNAPMGPVPADGSGNWSIELPEVTQDTATDITATADGGPESAALAIIFDTFAPSPSLEKAPAQDDPVSTGPVQFMADFGEEVEGFGSGGIVVSGSPAGNISVTGGPDKFSVSISTNGNEGFIAASIPAGVAMDLAGNFNLSAKSTDNRVDLDTDADPGSSPTELPLISGSASFLGFLHDSDTDTFTFTLPGTRIATLFTTGSLDTRGSLEDAFDVLLNSPDVDDDAGEGENFQMVETLGAGEYKVSVSSTGVGAYELSLETAALPELPVIDPNLALKSQLSRKIEKLKAKAKKVKKKGNTSKAKKLKQKMKKLVKQLRLL